MGSLIADIFVTIKPTPERLWLTARSLSSLLGNTAREQFRLTLCVDGYDPMPFWNEGWTDELHGCVDSADYLLTSRKNEGLGPTINRAVSHIKSINDWYAHPTHGDPSQVAPYVVMCQDDLLYSKDWLPILASRFRAYGMQHRLGFASGVEGIEHEKTRRKDLGGGMFLQDWIRAAQMLSTREYWESMMPIPRLDPETGRVRAKPNDGMGSGVDWWLIRNHENSVCRTGRTNLVMPGLVVHAGYDKSTWLQRELPESEGDKTKMHVWKIGDEIEVDTATKVMRGRGDIRPQKEAWELMFVTVLNDVGEPTRAQRQDGSPYPLHGNYRIPKKG